jgi:hypothetical protein
MVGRSGFFGWHQRDGAPGSPAGQQGARSQVSAGDSSVGSAPVDVNGRETAGLGPGARRVEVAGSAVVIRAGRAGDPPKVTEPVATS